MRACLFCGRRLSAMRSERAQYCDSACRASDYRKNISLQADEAKQGLDPPAAPVGDRALIASLIDPDPRGSTWRDRLGWFERTHPVALQTFGHDVLSAYAREADSEFTVCRWCLATSNARAHGTPLPSLGNTAHKALLGTPCQICMAQMRVDAVLKIDEVRREAKASKTVSTNTSPTADNYALEHVRKTLKHFPTKCGLCHAAYSGFGGKSAMVASGVPHEPTKHVRSFYI